MGQAKAQICSSIFRFIDNPCTFSNDIFPDELILMKENDDPCQAQFLDLLMQVYDGKCTSKQFDKSLSLSILLYVKSHALYHLWIAIYHLKYFMLQSVLNLYVLPGKKTDQFNLVTRVNVLLIGLKQQGSECSCIISSFHYGYLGNTLNYFIGLQIGMMDLSSTLYVTIFTYVYVYVCFMYQCINAYVYIHYKTLIK